MEEDLTLEDLATRSGLPLRTLRYYIQQGILQGPDTRGKYASYSQQHLDRLEVIQRMKTLRLPLQEIRILLENMTPEEVSIILQYKDIQKIQFEQPVRLHLQESSSSYPRSSALEYIHSLEKGRETVRALNYAPDVRASASIQPAPEAPSKQQKSSPPDSGEENWIRIVLKEGVELNVRLPIDAGEQTRIARLTEFARHLFQNQIQ